MVEFSYFYAMNRKVLDINISRVLALTGAVSEFSLGTDIVLGEVSGERLEKEQGILKLVYQVDIQGQFAAMHDLTIRFASNE